MTDFKSWCEPVSVVIIEGHSAGVLISSDDKADRVSRRLVKAHGGDG